MNGRKVLVELSAFFKRVFSFQEKPVFCFEYSFLSGYCHSKVSSSGREFCWYFSFLIFHQPYSTSMTVGKRDIITVESNIGVLLQWGNRGIITAGKQRYYDSGERGVMR